MLHRVALRLPQGPRHTVDETNGSMKTPPDDGRDIITGRAEGPSDYGEQRQHVIVGSRGGCLSACFLGVWLHKECIDHHNKIFRTVPDHGKHV